MSTQVTNPTFGGVIRQFNDSVSAQIGDLQIEFSDVRGELEKLREEIKALRLTVSSLRMPKKDKPEAPPPPPVRPVMVPSLTTDNEFLTPIPPTGTAPYLREIHNAVVSVMNFPGDLRYKCNRPDICQARHLFAYVARKYGYSYIAIAAAVSHHHSTMIHGAEKVRLWVAEHPHWAELVRKVEEQL